MHRQIVSVVCLLLLFSCVSTRINVPGHEKASWIGPAEVNPANRFTYFRKVVHLETLPGDTTVRFAADSNGQLWINGHAVRRKVSRYTEEKITAEVIDAGPYLAPGPNVIVVFHHSWGDIVTFQRTGNKRAGLFINSTWIRSDSTWKYETAPQMTRHREQILAVDGKTHRLRYPQILDGRAAIPSVHEAGFDDSRWKSTVVITDGPWPHTPADVETPGQEEERVAPKSVLAAGIALRRAPPVLYDPQDIGPGMRTAECRPGSGALRAARAFLEGVPLVIEGSKGESRFITFDFHQPVHGYPFLEFADADPGIVIDFGYGEISRSLHSGRYHVDETGWIDTGGVVGALYADRYITAQGEQTVELPDERTARWMALHFHFLEKGRVVLRNAGMVSSQYPFPLEGSFSCGNPWVDRIVRLGLVHARVTMTDAFVDTPGREDGQWYEDARLRAVLAARWSGDTRLRRFLIRTVAESQLDDGNFHAFPPSNYPFARAPFDWSLQWVAILHDEYVWSGDRSLVLQYFDALCRYWDQVLSHMDETGLWRTHRVYADIRVGLHPKKGGASGIITPWVIERLRWSAEMASAVGRHEKAGAWRSAAKRLTAGFRKYHLVPGTDSVPAHVADRFSPDDPDAARGFSQAGQTVAVYTGLLDEQEALALLDHAFPEPAGSPPAGVTRWNNPTYFYRALKALTHVGLDARAVNHMIERYGPYLPGHPANPVPRKLQGPLGGPLPEYWISREDLRLKPGEVSPAQPEDETGSHGWGAVPLVWLHDSLLGVSLLEAGGERIRITPRAGGLPYVRGTTVTPRGKVHVDWHPDRSRLEVVLPGGIVAEVVLPPPLKNRALRVNGKKAAASERMELPGGGVYGIQPWRSHE